MHLVFLPGASGNTEFWQPVRNHLNDHQSAVIAYPAFGGHPAHPDVNNFEDLQAYVLSRIQEPSVLIAQSMGGIFAVQAALQKTELIKGLILIATSGGIDLSPFNVADWREDYQQAFSVPDWFVGHQSYLDDQLYKIDCPVLLIWGDSDPISPVEVGQYLHQKFSSSELHVITQGQHDLAHVHAEQVSGLIQSFLQRNQVMKLNLN